MTFDVKINDENDIVVAADNIETVAHKIKKKYNNLNFVVYADYESLSQKIYGYDQNNQILLLKIRKHVK